MIYDDDVVNENGDFDIDVNVNGDVGVNNNHSDADDDDYNDDDNNGIQFKDPDVFEVERAVAKSRKVHV